MAGRRALVVGSDAATQVGLVGFLRARGFQCITASSLTETREALAAGSFALTLVDLSAEGADPRQLRESLALRTENSGPVIAVSYGAEDTPSIPIDAEAVLHKPVSLEELQQAIDKLVRPPAEALPTLGQQGGQIRRQMKLWCSPKMLDARQFIREAARVDVTVLI